MKPKQVVNANALLDDFKNCLDGQTFEIVEAIVRVHQGKRIYKCEIRENVDFSLCPNDPMNIPLFTGFVVTGNKALIRKRFKEKYPHPRLVDWHGRKDRVVDWNNSFDKYHLCIVVEEVEVSTWLWQSANIV